MLTVSSLCSTGSRCGTPSRKKKLLGWITESTVCSTGDLYTLHILLSVVNVLLLMCVYVVKEYTRYHFYFYLLKTSDTCTTCIRVRILNLYFVIFFSGEQSFRDGFHLYNSPLYNSSSSSYMSSYNATFVFISVPSSIPNSLNASLNASSSSATPKS